MARTFAQKKILAILGLALVLAPVKFPTVTNDKLLTAVFGGFFLGMGIGLAVCGGNVIDGAESSCHLSQHKNRGRMGRQLHG